MTAPTKDFWEPRPIALALLGALTALITYYLTKDYANKEIDQAWQTALSTSLVGFSIAFGLTSTRQFIWRDFAFSAIVALVVGLIFYQRFDIGMQDKYTFASLLLSLVILTPFYQTTRDTGNLKYGLLHQYAWSNAVIIALSLIFALFTYAVARLIGTLLTSSGVFFLSEALAKQVGIMVLFGLAIGSSVGVLRNNDSIIASTLSIVQKTLSILIVPLVIALGVFLFKIVFDGIQETINGITATVLSSLLFSIIVVNAVIRDDEKNQSKSQWLMTSALLLSLFILPLSLVAGVALKSRIEQYGWTPDRLWATVLCATLGLYGLAYFCSILSGRNFSIFIRKVNVYLALVIACVALLLATPFLDFREWSAKDQLARFENGTTTEEQFDVAAMAFDFGPSGRKKLSLMRETATESMVQRIDISLNAKYRWNATTDGSQKNAAASVTNLERLAIIHPTKETPDKLTAELRLLVNNAGACRNDSYCYLYFSESGKEALLVKRHCMAENSRVGDCQPFAIKFSLEDNKWSLEGDRVPEFRFGESRDILLNKDKLDRAAQSGKLELRPVERRQLFVDGQPIGPTIK